MVDIHCHILPGLDDGPDTFEESMALAEMAIEEGVTHIVGTPHSNEQFKFDPELIRKRRDELQERVGDRLTLATGCDCHFSFENLREIETNRTKFTINQKNYLLVEFNDFAIPPNAEDTLHHLQLLGIAPIITHPERNPLIRRDAARLRRWLHQGCYVQITAMSVTGKFGESAKKYADQWLDEDMVHFIASDAHSIERRPLRLRGAFEAVAARRGEQVAEALFQSNPLAAFEGRPLPYAPEHLEVGREQPTRRKKRFGLF